jgi:hypothetical protein
VQYSSFHNHFPNTAAPKVKQNYQSYTQIALYPKSSSAGL